MRALFPAFAGISSMGGTGLEPLPPRYALTREDTRRPDKRPANAGLFTSKARVIACRRASARNGRTGPDWSKSGPSLPRRERLRGPHELELSFSRRRAAHTGAGGPAGMAPGSLHVGLGGDESGAYTASRQRGRETRWQ